LVGTTRQKRKDHRRYADAVRGVDRHRMREADEGTKGYVQPCDAPVRDGAALAKAGSAKTRASEQAIEHQAAREGVLVLEEESYLLEQALLARHLQVDDDVLLG
jgi:hypothetical protein